MKHPFRNLDRLCSLPHFVSEDSQTGPNSRAYRPSCQQATETLIKHLDSKRENISIRAAEGIVEFAQKPLEHKELEKRVEALEARLMQQGGNFR